MREVASTVRVNADVETVYRAAQDLEGLAAYIGDVESIAVTEREESPGGLATVSVWVGLLPEFRRKLHWTERDVWDDAARLCRFELIQGDWDEYEGEWRFEPDGEATVVSLVVRYRYDVPLIGPLIQKLVLKKVQDSTDGIQAGLKRRAEEARPA
ncbi:MAG: SRPBCC family protein [Armatimonadetes bacterium]|nr:SRPBCC family protein [Armatimonadota bacterium]